MRKTFLAALVFFFVSCLWQVVFAQEEQSAQASPKLVTAIEVKGNKSTSTNTIISKMKTRVGSAYQENVISDDLKRLYLLGFFSDININTEDYKDGLKVIVNVVERPIIEKLSFSGFHHIRMTEDKIREQLKTKEAQYLDYPALNEDVKTIKAIYGKKGYSKCKVEYKIDTDPQTNRAKLTFSVEEGARMAVKRIYVEGNNSFSDGKILRVMKTKQAWLFNPGILMREAEETGEVAYGQKIKKKVNVLDEDMKRIESFYQKNGFADTRAGYVVKEDAKRPFYYITVTISEGKKYLVGNITVQGNKDIPEKDILAGLKECVPGEVFNQDALQQDVANIQSLYFDRGYISCDIQETSSVNTYTGRVDITYKITENQVAYVDKIKIRGNVKTRDLVIRRELRIRPSDRFDGEKLRRSREKLQNLGFFEDISYDTEDTNVSNKKNLVVEVKETKTGTFTFGGGYSTVDKLVGFVEIEQKNFDWRNFPYFTGAGQDLRFRGSFGTVSGGFDLSFTEPWVFDYPVSFGFDAYQRKHKRDEDVGYGYDEVVTGGDLRLGKEIFDYLRADLMYRRDHIKISNLDSAASQDLKKEEGKNSISSLKFGSDFDTRNNIYDPKMGSLISGSMEWAGGFLGGSRNFWKFYGRASHYFPMLRNSALEVRARAGLTEPYGSSDGVPIYERFFAGGAYTIRGYEERKVGPVDPASQDPLGGESLLIGNLEYTYPLFDFLKLAAFFDSGNVWGKLSDIGSGGFKSGFGIGVRVKTPIGPIMLDYGIPLNKEPGEDKRKSGRIHFSASHGF